MDVKSAVARAKGNGGHLDGNAVFKSALGEVGKAEISVFYLDAKTLFEKLYGLGKTLTPYAKVERQGLPADLLKQPQIRSFACHRFPVRS